MHCETCNEDTIFDTDNWKFRQTIISNSYGLDISDGLTLKVGITEVLITKVGIYRVPTIKV